MKDRGKYKHLLNRGAGLMVIIIEGIIFSYIWYTVYAGSYGFYKRGNWAVIGLYILILFFFTKVFGGYNIGYMRTVDIILSHSLSIFMGGAVGYIELCMVCRDYVSIYPMVGAVAAELVFVIPWVCIIRALYLRLYPPHQMLVIYGEYPPDELIRKINLRKDQYHVCAVTDYRIGEDKLHSIVDRYQAVVLCDLPSEVRNQIMKYCYKNSIRTYVTPKISDIIFKGADDIHLFDTPLLLSRNQGLTINQRIAKRMIDIAVSVVGIIVASPLMAVLAMAVRLYDRGPVIYSQERLTRDGKKFMIYKFRSMKVDSEAHGARLAYKGDKRVTPVGSIMRNTHLDELPQLFNILKGDMSVVGPRPERQEISDEYEKKIPEFPFRTKVKAGLTGYAQVYGKYNTTPYDKLKLDLTYIENYSLWLDFKIMLLTVKVLFQKENTEGIEEEKKNAMR